jgi:hypothetical protein
MARAPWHTASLSGSYIPSAEMAASSSSSSNQIFHAAGNRGVFTGANHGTINNNFQGGKEEQKSATARLFLTDPDIDHSNLLVKKGEPVNGIFDWIFADERHKDWSASASASNCL